MLVAAKKNRVNEMRPSRTNDAGQKTKKRSEEEGDGSMDDDETTKPSMEIASVGATVRLPR
jgi:hypothetical protein